jgi:hypothetical protein
MAQTQYSTNWVSGILLVALLATVSASTAAEVGSFNPAEKWVIERVTAGEVADLDAALNADQSKRFPAERDRKLGAQFLEDLLMGLLPEVKPHRNGVRIRWAIVDEPIKLRNAQIPWEVWLLNCQFRSAAIFAGANFKGIVSFNASTFAADADFYGMKVGQSAYFRKAFFEGPVDFGAADIAHDFAAEEAEFTNREQGANFNSMKAGHSALLNNAVFEGPVNFGAANIASNFEADKAQFKNKEKAANFNSMKVGQAASFQNSVFEGPVDFGAADITNHFQATEAQFKNGEQEASFNAMKVGGSAFFEKAVFEGPVNFIAADIAKHFDARQAQFKNKKQPASFNGIKVEAAIFHKVLFEGPVDFNAADIASNFEAPGAQFRSKTETIQLQMKCGRKGVFTEATFAGPASFAGSSFLYLMISGPNADTTPIPQLDLSRSSIKGQLSMRRIRVHDLVAPSLHVEGPAAFTDIVVEHSADLSDGDFETLDLSRSVWPRNGHNGQTFQMRGMNYKYLRGADANESTSHNALLKLADQSAFTADVYGHLETFFLRQGYGADADRAFIAGKRREREESLRRKEYLSWLGSKLLDCLVGYGRHPSHAGYFCAFFVGLGFVLFAPKKMELQKSEDTPRIYNRFWYSLGLFLPVVNLEADKVWKPKPNQTFLRNYMRVHILLGWILIPIFLAALSGLIK